MCLLLPVYIKNNQPFNSTYADLHLLCRHHMSRRPYAYTRPWLFWTFNHRMLGCSVMFMTGSTTQLLEGLGHSQPVPNSRTRTRLSTSNSFYRLKDPTNNIEMWVNDKTSQLHLMHPGALCHTRGIRGSVLHV